MIIDSADSKPQRRVAVYIRVSTSEQKVSGYGLEAQKSRLLQYIEDQKASRFLIKDSWIFSDTHTGSDINRPGLQQMLKLVRQKRFDAVLVWKIDRLSRSLKHLLSIFEDLEKNGISFVSVQENIDFTGPMGKLIFQIFGAIAQFERGLIRDRTRMGKIASAEMGNYTGSSIPYGYKPTPNPSGKGKKLEIIPAEKKWVQSIYNWHIFEDMGYGQIAGRLNELKVPKGKYVMKRSQATPWNEKTVREILTNHIYRGEFIANRKDENGVLLPEDQWTLVSIPKCVTELTFQQAQCARQIRSGGETSTNYLLSGKLFDMTLEKPKRFSGCKRSKGGFSYRRKQFKDKKGRHIPLFEIPGKQLEEYIWDKITMAMSGPEDFIKYYLSREYIDPVKAENQQLELDKLRSELARCKSLDIPRIESAYERGIYDEDKLQEKLTEKNATIARLEDAIGIIEDQLAIVSNTNAEVEKLRATSAELKYKLDKLNREQKKVLCQLFVDRVELYRERQSEKEPWQIPIYISFRFNPDRLPRAKNKGGTEKRLGQAHKGIFWPKNGEPGGIGGDGYTTFQFLIRLKSTRQTVSIEEPISSCSQRGG